MKVPSAVAITVAMIATSTEFVRAFERSGSANGCCQWRRVKPCQVKLNRPWLSLNEKRMTMKTGMNRYSSASADQMASAQLRTPSPRGRPRGGASSSCSASATAGDASTVMSDRRLGEVARAEQPGVDEDADEDEQHQRERQRRRRRVIEDVQELRLDDVADHVLARGAEQRGVDEVAAGRDEREQRAGEDSRQRERQRDLAKGGGAAGVAVGGGLQQAGVDLLQRHVERQRHEGQEIVRDARDDRGARGQQAPVLAEDADAAQHAD